MLKYEPEKRATAKEMLDHPWLNMPADFEFKMTERDYEMMSMIKKSKGDKKVLNIKDIIDSETEQNIADNEDNENIDTRENEEEDEDSFLEPTETINIQNFNNSFAIYGQHVKLSALDKANPQFAK